MKKKKKLLKKLLKKYSKLVKNFKYLSGSERIKALEELSNTNSLISGLLKETEAPS